MIAQVASGRKVLIVEDNPTDAMLVQMALQEGGLPFVAEIVTDGEAAIRRLCSEGQHHHLGHPEIIILDLNLPKRDGTEVLQVIRASVCHKHVPVLVLSSSPDYVTEKKVNAAKVKADCYLTKPPNLEEFLALGKLIWQCFEEARTRETSQAAS